MVMLFAEVQAGFYGHVDTRVQADSYFEDSDSFVEEYAELRYVDKANNLEAGMNMALRQAEDNEAEVYQLYVDKKLSVLDSSVKVGRFERADSLGFYSLDGIALSARPNDDYLISLSAGRPQRIDEFHTVKADAVYAIDFRFDDLLRPSGTSHTEYPRVTTRLGLQRLEDDDVHQTRLNWGLSVRGERDVESRQSYGMDVDAVYLPKDEDFESLRFELFTNPHEKGRIQVDYDAFTLNDPYLTFTDRFYSMYVLGRQTSASLGYFYSLSKQQTLELSGRNVQREQGKSGYGLTMGYRLRNYLGDHYQAQLDYLTLEQDSSVSLYASASKSLSAMTRSHFSAALQRQEKWLTGDNTAIGLQANIERVLSSGLYLTFSGSYIENSSADDDYLFSLNLSYQFEAGTGGWDYE
jgi:hypothetical protein